MPALVTEDSFARAQELLHQNKIRSRRRTIAPSVVQGLVTCAKCGYALSRTSTQTSARKIHYYKCIGSEGWRKLGGPVCDNGRFVRQELLDQIVWAEVIRLLEEPALIRSPSVFDKFIAAWEDGSLPKALWTHAGYVAVGAFYAVRHPSNAFERTRSGILRYNVAVGTENSDVSGYHETLTRFWADVLARFVKGIADPWEAAVKAVDQFGEDRDLHHLYYSFDIVRSPEARRAWIPPDLDGPY